MKWVLHILYDTCDYAKKYFIVEEIECVVEISQMNERHQRFARIAYA